LSSEQLFILAGESSGDLHGSNLAKALSGHSLFGVAGPRMRDAGVECLIPSEEFAVMGFFDVLIALKRLKKHFKTVLSAILERQPRAVILIDFGGFNLRLARALRKAGYGGKIVQYISPKVWAWGKGRIPKIAAAYDLMLVIYPFETNCYEGTSLETQFVGNPLTEALLTHPYKENWAESRGIDPSAPLLAIFPGSRKSEIELNLKRQLETARHLDPNLQVAVSVANSTVEPLIHKLVADDGWFLIPSGEAYDLMRASRAALATSGTVTMELALHRVPTICVYRPGWINAIIARLILRLNLPHYCMVNIAAGKEIFPELIHTQFTPKRAAKELQKMLDDGETRDRCLAGCDELRALLSDAQASQRAAEAILTTE
jgi:lipid-A-disaccharide synthase